MGEEDIHTQLTWVFEVKNFYKISINCCMIFTRTLFGFDWGQSYLATLVTPQNCIKMLRGTFFAYFCIKSNEGREQQKNFCFFEQFLLQKQLLTILTTFLKIAGNFLRNLEQLVESPSEIFVRHVVTF